MDECRQLQDQLRIFALALKTGLEIAENHLAGLGLHNLLATTEVRLRPVSDECRNFFAMLGTNRQGPSNDESKRMSVVGLGGNNKLRLPDGERLVDSSIPVDSFRRR